jgi:hypothetical protein
MPHYYFDHEIDGTTVRDDEGVTLQSLAVARDEAALMIVALEGQGSPPQGLLRSGPRGRRSRATRRVAAVESRAHIFVEGAILCPRETFFELADSVDARDGSLACTSQLIQ